ncbi:MAG TPA: hypothetical protein VNI02_08030 [Blastocatellia bacterium]|jgi:hypothetical protein|nr:hypothetical protein [Blastocatellia bacterium]
MGIIIDEVASSVVPDATPSTKEAKGPAAPNEPELDKTVYLLSKIEQREARLRAD